MKRNAALLARSVLMRNAVIAVLISCVTLSSAQAKGFDGLKVFFCGTGGPLPSSGRAQPCTAVQAGGVLYLVVNGMAAGIPCAGCGGR